MESIFCFNPLHCGAVVASRHVLENDPSLQSVFQSPSLRGSGRFRRKQPYCRLAPCLFQSPSLRGSGRFRCGGARRAPPQRFVSIPFIAGQWSLPGAGARCEGSRIVSIPFIAGQWSLLAARCGPLVRPPVSIPFIAGQWSLPGVAGGKVRQPGSFNPLHCGAVVASRRMAGVAGGKVRFNPLHCGAVVASRRRMLSSSVCETLVSIPFIAGQWSLRAQARVKREIEARFNPLHCGAVVASSRPPPHGGGARSFNPLHCGAVVASRRRRGARATPKGARVSIPFIAGQWSLRAAQRAGPH